MNCNSLIKRNFFYSVELISFVYWSKIKIKYILINIWFVEFIFEIVYVVFINKSLIYIKLCMF